MITVVIVSYNTRDILRNCLDALYTNSREIDMEVIVVDNASHDGSPDMIRSEFPMVRLIVNSVNSGFAAANNQAYAVSSGRYIVLLNPDAYLRPSSLANGIAFMDSNPFCGLCGGKIISPEGRLEPSARRFPSALSKLLTISGLSWRFSTSSLLNRHEFGGFAHDRPMDVDWVPGTFTIVRRKMLESIGFFDERFYLYYEETDLCLRAKKAGWKVFFIPDAEVMHIGGASSKTRKDKTFDNKASQVLNFRLRSEWLYHRKNRGLALMLASAGVELFWNSVRFARNLLSSGSEAGHKREAAAALNRQIVQSLRDTRFGLVSPPTPW
jgi:GT2 family glycosyltransferase